MIIADIVKIFIPATLSFIVGILLAPLLTHYLYTYKAWKKSSGKTAFDGTPAVEFEKLRTTVHAGTETSTPRMGGLLIWVTTTIVTISLWLLHSFNLFAGAERLDFLSRSQTWIPLVTLLVGGLVGFVNDLLDLQPLGERGIRLSVRLLIIFILSLFIGWWFYDKLEVTGIGIPLDGVLTLGWFVIPLFILVSLGLYAGGVIDGIDGLAGGVFASMFASYAGIAFFQQQLNLAAFCTTLVGAILAFLWFNIPPARFWMTETGTMGLTLTLAVVAFMTDTLGEGYGLVALPIIALPLFATVASNILQIASKKIWGKKLFRIAPLHHHFEALGWPPYKVTMRYWVLSAVCAIAGMTVALLK
jgi:phospho-N-acetylmuramoyl-pentapeptide-transferase